MPLYFIHLRYLTLLTTLHVKVFAWSPFGNQLFWFREIFLQIKSPVPKFSAPWWPKWLQLGGLLTLPLCTPLCYRGKSVSGFSNDVFFYEGGTLTYHPTPKLEGHVMQPVSPFYPKLAQHGWTHQEPKSQLVELLRSSRHTNLPTMLSCNTHS